MTNNLNMLKILETPDEQRDSQWENRFFHALTEGNVDLFGPEAQTGPDGWPYLLTKTEPDSTEPFQRVLTWISDKGIGLVINPQKEFPDYVFNYGMLWHFKETGLFYRDRVPAPEGIFEFNTKDIKKAGEPSTAYLPIYVRAVIREFFVQQGVLGPRVLAFSLDGENFELAFSTESLGQPEQQEHQGILEAITWFLPPHYQVALVSEKELAIPFVNL